MTVMKPVLASQNSSLIIKTVIIVAIFFMTAVILTVREDIFPFKVFKSMPVIYPLAQTEEKLKLKAKMATLNYSLPNFAALNNFLINPRKDKSTTQSFIEYYERVNQSLPDIAESYGMLGVLYYYSGQISQARDALLKAHELNPRFFWHVYNLGLLYREENNEAEAVKYFKMAVSLPPQETVKTIYTSRIYRQILGEIQQEKIVSDLKSAYTKAYQMTKSSVTGSDKLLMAY